MADSELHDNDSAKERFKRALAGWMRKWADRIDYAGAPKVSHFSFTFERNLGIRWREDGRGCPVWIPNDTAYMRAHAEADTEHPVVNWADMTVRSSRDLG